MGELARSISVTLHPVEPDEYLHMVNADGRGIIYKTGLLAVSSPITALSSDSGVAQQLPIGEGGIDTCPRIVTAKEVSRDIYNLFLEKYNREKKEHCAAVAKACTPLDLRKRILQELLEETETCRADLVRREGPGPQIEDLLRKISQL